MQKAIFVRRAEHEDAKVIADFNCRMARETENKQLNQELVEQGVLGMIEEPARGFYLLAGTDTKIQACLMITYEWSDWRNAMFWWIQSVYVKPEVRRQGYYSALYNEARSLAKSEHCCGIRLYVEKDNQAAQYTYQSLGMEHCDYLMYEEEF